MGWLLRALCEGERVMTGDVVYVVTVSSAGEEVIGEFHLAEVYPSEAVAVTVAGECMEARGGRDRFREVTDVEQAAHVVRQWYSPRWTVWLERLAVVR